MKKNVLLILLSAALLTGCEFDITLASLGKKKENESTPTEEKENENTPSTPTTEEDPPKPETPTEEREDIKDEYTATILLSGNSFAQATSTRSGYQLDDSTYAEHVSALKEYCDSNLEYENLITKINCTDDNTAELYSKIYFCVGTGYHVNGKFKPGTFKWTSGEKIYRVEIKALAYAKEYNNTVNPDTISHVWIDSDDHSLETTSAPEVQTFSKEYGDGTNSFSIKSTGSRVLLESITITWRG